MSLAHHTPQTLQRSPFLWKENKKLIGKTSQKLIWTCYFTAYYMCIIQKINIFYKACGLLYSPCLLPFSLSLSLYLKKKKWKQTGTSSSMLPPLPPKKKTFKQKRAFRLAGPKSNVTYEAFLNKMWDLQMIMDTLTLAMYLSRTMLVQKARCIKHPALIWSEPTILIQTANHSNLPP